MEACSPAGGIGVIAGWIEVEELSLAPLDILLGRSLKAPILEVKAKKTLNKAPGDCASKNLKSGLKMNSNYLVLFV